MSLSKTYLLTQVAERLGVGRRTVEGFVRSHELEAINVSRTPGSKKPRYRVTEEALKEFEQRRATTAAQPTPVRRRKRSLQDDDDFVKYF